MKLEPWMVLSAGVVLALLLAIAALIYHFRVLFAKVLKDCTTENNGQSYDVVRIMVIAVGAPGTLTFFGCTIYSVIASDGHRFDYVSYGTALCAILAGLATTAAGIALKQRTDT